MTAWLLNLQEIDCLVPQYIAQGLPGSPIYRGTTVLFLNIQKVTINRNETLFLNIQRVTA